jgi:hypothetical protein
MEKLYGEANNKCVAESDGNAKSCDYNSVELRPKQQHINTCRVISTPEYNHNYTENSHIEKVTDERQRKKSVSLIKSKFESSMDYSDTGSEKEIFSTPDPSSSDDSASQPNSLTGGSILMNAPRTHIEDIESGRKSSQGFSRNKPNQTPLQNNSLDSNLPKNKKSNVLGRSTDGGRKKLSTVSLQDVDEKVKKVQIFGERSDSYNEDDEQLSPLQRRNSIHNVPFVDVNDPDTRSRMEKYKEERRSTLRAKYKVEDYRSEKQQPINSTKTSEDDNADPISTFLDIEKNLSLYSGEISSSSNDDCVRMSHSPKLPQETDQSKVSLRKLPVGNKVPKQLRNVNPSHQQHGKLTNISHAKSNADRKWSIQTGVKQAKVENDASSIYSSHTQDQMFSSSNPTPPHGNKLEDCKSTKQAHRSSCPPQVGQDDEDVNVKERAALWNGNQGSCGNRNINQKDRKISTTGKSTLKSNPPHRKISEPISHTLSYHQLSNDVMGKEKRVKSLSLSTAPSSTFRSPQRKDERSYLQQSAKTVFLKEGKNNEEPYRQSTNVQLPSPPNKIRNMTAFFEQNS